MADLPDTNDSYVANVAAALELAKTASKAKVGQSYEIQANLDALLDAYKKAYKVVSNPTASD